MIVVATSCGSDRARDAATAGVATTFASTRPRLAAPPPPAPAFVEIAYPFLDDEDPDVSVSVGGTSDGRIVNARQVVEGEHVAILEKQRARDLGYGSQELVALLDEVGARTKIIHGSPLWIGNIGRRGGGDIPWSVSHNAGRDADVAFAYLDARGVPIDPPGLVALDREGRSKDGTVRFDVARTWTIVAGIVESDAASVQFVFVSEPLKQKLLRHARAIHAPATTIARADLVLRQPRGALPHDDHLHVRVRCTPRDAGRGCVDLVDPDPAGVAVRAERVARARQLVTSNDDAQRRNAALRLALLEAGDALPALSTLLGDPVESVRFAAATSLTALGSEREVDAMAERLRREDDPHVQRRLLGGIARLGGARAGSVIRDFLAPLPFDGQHPEAPTELGPRQPEPFLFDLLAREAEASGASLRLVALEAARYVDSLEPLDALLTLLESGTLDERRAAAVALARITNLAPKSLGAPTDESAAADRQTFDRLKRVLGAKYRDGWLVAGFRAAGYDVRALDKRYAWELVRATRGADHVSYNAQRSLVRMLGLPARAIRDEPERACLDFLKMVDAGRQRLRLAEPPRGLRASCTIQN